MSGSLHNSFLFNSSMSSSSAPIARRTERKIPSDNSLIPIGEMMEIDRQVLLNIPQLFTISKEWAHLVPKQDSIPRQVAEVSVSEKEKEQEACEAMDAPDEPYEPKSETMDMDFGGVFPADLPEDKCHE